MHLDDAAAATVLAVDRGVPGLFNVVDDEPAPVREWLPVLAETIGGASNEKAKHELGWRLHHPTWREGFPASYAATD